MAPDNTSRQTSWQSAPHESVDRVTSCFRSRSDVGVAGGACRHLCLHHRRPVQSCDRCAGRRGGDRHHRPARPRRGDQGRRLEYDRPLGRHDDPGLDLTPLGAVSIPRNHVGAAGAGEPGRHSAHAAAGDGRSLGGAQQCQHRSSHGAGHAGDRRGAGAAALSVSVRGSVRRQYRRHRDPDRRPAQYPDRHAGGPRLQRLPRQCRAGGAAGDGGAGGACSPDLGAFAARERGTPRPWSWA